ncbi:YeeE/YedE thiosulfate transporter family protein [Nevskia sp.]|uniref:YeeE/YedE thiosulfate transporter family protein n=1 Tax=Nevskia sp. TaxID=1929292 RepID=UPI0025F81600|nr:YeeE/YedE thiosulfate transporter family protein [Nevskia sp.]
MSAMTSSSGPRPFWQPHLAGVLLGLGLLMTFVLTGHGLGASGFTTALAATTADVVAPATTESSSYWGPMFENGRNPLDSWITWQVIGAAIGALIGAMTAGRFQISYDGPVRLSKPKRLAMAFAGGAISGLGARISLGCTSGLGLSGAATLASAGFLFLGGFFITGAIIGLATRRIWQ